MNFAPLKLKYESDVDVLYNPKIKHLNQHFYPIAVV